MRDLAHTNPFEVGLAGGIDWDKEFIGKEALLKVREEGPAREMVGFEVLDEDIYIRAKQYGGPGEPVFIEGEEEEVGRVSKLVYSYVKEVNNGYITGIYWRRRISFILGTGLRFMDMMR